MIALFVRFILRPLCLWVLAWPIAKLLGKVLREEGESALPVVEPHTPNNNEHDYYGNGSMHTGRWQHTWLSHDQCPPTANLA